jgi:hypothetical protein
LRGAQSGVIAHPADSNATTQQSGHLVVPLVPFTIVMLLTAHCGLIAVLKFPDGQFPSD